MISQDFYTFINASANVNAIARAIHPQMLPYEHRGFPAITWAMDADDAQTLLEGISSLRIALIAVDCWDGSYILAHSLADVLKTELVGYTGQFGASTVDQIRQERELDLYEPDTRLHRVSLQFSVAYS